MRYRVESGESSEQPFIHVQSKPLRVGETFFHPPSGASDKVGHGFHKVLSIEPATDDVDAVVKAARLEASSP